MTEPLVPPDVEPGTALDATDMPAAEVPAAEAPAAEAPAAEVPRAGGSPADDDEPNAGGRAPRSLFLAAVLAAGVALGVSVTLVVVMRRAPSPSEHASVAKLAASELDASVASVAEACGVEPGEGASPRETLRLAFERCSPDPFRPGPPPPDALLLPPRPARPADGQALPHKLPPERPDPCLERCARAHDACGKTCGPEPVGDAFVAWQACGTRCLTDNSRCRLGCP